MGASVGASLDSGKLDVVVTEKGECRRGLA